MDKFSPVAVTPDVWRDGKLHLPLNSTLNSVKIGSPNAGVDITFNFAQLIEHAAKTRSLTAGTIIGSETVANQNSLNGSSCLAEVRSLEVINNGEAKTPFMKFGDLIEIEMYDREGNSIFGKISQRVKELQPV